MSVKDLSNTSGTNWAALEAMDDDDIDYSDIPPLTEDFFKHATLRLPIPYQQPPTHPGKVLKEMFLRPMNISERELSEAIHVPLDTVNEIVRGDANLNPGEALRLAKYFRTTADYWMTLQLRWDLHHAQQVESKALASIEPRQSA